jgi:hypothetical protein
MADPPVNAGRGTVVEGLNERAASYALTDNATSLAFPSNLGSYPFWMSFSFYEYKRPKFTDNPILQNKNNIRLPLPNQMVDHQDVVYAQEEAGLVAGGALNQYLNGSGSIGDVAAATGWAAVGAAVGANRLSGKTPNLLAQLGGVATNPFLTVMFKSPAFKKHVFSWRLSPTNVKESQALAAIVQTLRYNQLPDVSGSLGGALLTYPNIVQLTVSTASSSFKYMFKPAVIESLSINFAPGGQPSFFGSTKAPTEVEIRLSLLEIEYYLQRDYGNPNTAGLTLASDLANLLENGIKDILGAPTLDRTQQEQERINRNGGAIY